MKITFEQVKYKHRAKDSKGKWKQMTFTQTINPWNVNEKGDQKSRKEIYEELKQEAAEWARKISTPLS